jgi:hypothetical protein
LPLYFALTAAVFAAGCQHDVQMRALDAEGRYERTLREAHALAVESDGRRRVLLQSSASNEDKTLGGGSLLLYLSFDIDPVHGIDLKHPKVFLSLSDVALSFSGFLDADAVKEESGPNGETVSGRFTGTLSAQGRDQTRDVTITLDKTPVTDVGTREEIDRKGYAAIIREHLYNLDFDAADREYWSAPAAGAAIPREHK